jgi:endonuclease YncB( thermonuclease family)
MRSTSIRPEAAARRRRGSRPAAVPGLRRGEQGAVLPLFICLGALALLLSAACDPGGPSRTVASPEPWPTVPEPRRTPLSLPSATLPPPTPEPTATRGPQEFVGRQWGRVVRVWDGQSFLLENGTTVRYLGLQAPGGGVFGRGLQPYGREAAQRNSELVEGREVELEQDVTDVDGEGQLPRYVFVDGQFVNEDLVSSGLANAAARAPDLRRQATLDEAEREAREARRGIWTNAPTLTRTPAVAAPRPAAPRAPAATVGPSPSGGPSPTGGAAAGTPPAGPAGTPGAAPAATTPGPNPAAPAAGPTAAGAPAAATTPAAGGRPAATPASGAIPRFGESVPPTPAGGGTSQP